MGGRARVGQLAFAARRHRSTWASLAEANEAHNDEALARGAKTIVTVKMAVSDSPVPADPAALPREPLEHAEMKMWSAHASKTMSKAANMGRENLSKLLPVAEHQKVLLELIEQQFSLMDVLQNKLDDAHYLREENANIRQAQGLEISRLKLQHAAELEAAQREPAVPVVPGDQGESQLDPSLLRLQHQMARDRHHSRRPAVSDINFGGLRLS